jgi:DNA excision repair protein ERCC-4
VSRVLSQQVELDELTVENALFRNFDRVVRGRLDPIWHRVGPKTKRLVQDLTTLRNLLKSVSAARDSRHFPR